MAEPRVLLRQDFEALGFEVLDDDQVGRARENVIGADQVESLGLLFVDEPFDAGQDLLVWRGTRVDDVLRRFVAFILDRVEQQAIVVFERGQHVLAAHGGPAAEDGDDLVLEEQLLGQFGEFAGEVRGRIFHDRHDLLAENAAGRIDFFNGHEFDVLQRGFADGHGSGQ